MGFFPYLAMTAAEIQGIDSLPAKLGYMACHFSSYGTGLSNCPTSLPPGSILILNDRIPICGHSPDTVAAQVAEMAEAFSCDSVLLDFQRPDNAETAAVCRRITESCPCPVGVSHLYAQSLSCPVFLPLPPLDQPLQTHLAPWNGRELWLEVGLQDGCFTLTPKGCTFSESFYEMPPEACFLEESLHCRYRIEPGSEETRFYLYRGQQELDALLQEAEALGVAKVIGLYQQLGKMQ